MERVLFGTRWLVEPLSAAKSTRSAVGHIRKQSKTNRTIVRIDLSARLRIAGAAPPAVADSSAARCTECEKRLSVPPRLRGAIPQDEPKRGRFKRQRTFKSTMPVKIFL